MNPDPTIAGSATQTVPAPDLGVQITDVNSSAWQYVFHHKPLKKAWHLVVLLLWEALMVWLLIKTIGLNRPAVSSDGTANGGTGGLPFIFIGWGALIPLLIIGGSFIALKESIEDAFLKAFAAANGYTFTKDGTVDKTQGSIFHLGGWGTTTDVVTGTYRGCGLQLFLYEAKMSQRSAGRDYTVLELDLHGQLPSLFMVNKAHQDADEQHLRMGFGADHTISLEGDFYEYFTLYAAADLEVEAREVFTPDIMALMESAATHYSVEFTGSKIFIYAQGYVSRSQDLTAMFTLAKQLIAKMEPLASRIAEVASPTA